MVYKIYVYIHLTRGIYKNSKKKNQRAYTLGPLGPMFFVGKCEKKIIVSRAAYASENSFLLGIVTFYFCLK